MRTVKVSDRLILSTKSNQAKMNRLSRCSCTDENEQTMDHQHPTDQLKIKEHPAELGEA
jgi:hypothetical protein